MKKFKATKNGLVVRDFDSMHEVRGSNFIIVDVPKKIMKKFIVNAGVSIIMP